MPRSSHLADWTAVRTPLERGLPAFLSTQRWFGGKTREIRAVDIVDFLPVPLEGAPAAIVLARLDYGDGGAETYCVPLIEAVAGRLRTDAPSLTIRTARGKDRTFCDALWDPAFLAQLLDALAEGGQFPGLVGELAGLPTESLNVPRGAAESLAPSVMKAEQSNTSILYGRSFVLKFFRHVEEGINPDFEIGQFLSGHAGFRHVPPTAGCFEYRRPGRLPATLGILQGFVPNRGDAWQQTLGALEAFYDRVERTRLAASTAKHPLPDDLLGESLASARLLGRRTAQLHLALASSANDPEFVPEPLSLGEQQEIAGSMATLAAESFGVLRRRVDKLPGALRESALKALGAEQKILERFRQLGERPFGGLRIRIHGDLHLGQVLATEDDFVFIDFEGEPARSLAERRAKYSPVRDVAGMLRSFHYAAYAALFRRAGEAGVAAPMFVALAPVALAWYRRISGEFLESYLSTASNAPFLPSQRENFDSLLALYLLDKAVYELKYELNHRLGWVAIPLEGIHGLMEASGQF